ncbi:MAG: SpoIIE family protein phosphatase [Actinomycetota bacterium]
MVSRETTPAAGAAGQIHELERTLESLREDSEVAHVLLSLSGVLAEVRSVEETLDKAVKVVAEILRADRAFAVTLADDGARFEVRAHTGFGAERLAQLHELASSPEGLSLIKMALRELSPVLVGDMTVDERVDADIARQHGVGAFIGIPVARWGDEFGGIGVEFNHPRRFMTKDEALVRGISRQIGVAMTNSRRFNLLGGLRAFGLSLGSKLSLSTVITQISWGSASLLGGDLGAVYFLDSTSRALVAAGGLAELMDMNEDFPRISLDQEPWRALVQGRSILVRDLGTDEAPISAVAAPIPGEGTPMLGAVVVFFRRRLALAPDETEALSVLAGQAGMGIENANRFERQRRVARSLQAGLLSTEMPQLEGFEIAAVYEPASGEADIGGDFFDVFSVGEDKYAMVVGDVSGKGAEAAARTAMAKYMLRAFAMRNPTPSSALYYLNNALTHDLEADRFATLVYGVFDIKNRRWTIARGGHPPPLVLRAATGKVEAYEDLQGPILGAFEDMQFQQESFDMAAGDVILLYTDGIIEARSSDGAFYGRRRIEEGLARYGQMSAHELTLKIFSDAQQFGEISDDTVVFAIRCTE